MRLELLFLGKTKEAYLDEGIRDFSARLEHFIPVALTYFKVRRIGGKNEEEIKAYESSLLNSRLAPGDYRVVLDRSGRQFSSEELAVLFEDLIGRGVKKAVFAIGGPAGLAEEQLRGADLLLSLSRMTFTHEMTRLLLLEQLYRAFTIRAGTGYHK